ncbi:MAG: response regulator transcription factor [Terracoccus sp.]
MPPTQSATPTDDASPTERIRVLIVDDHALYRRGLQTILDTEEGFEVVGEAADGVAAVTQAEETLPDVIVMDVGMPKRGGIEACRLIRQRVPSARILMLTSSDDEANLFEAVRAGANGYLLKDVPPEEVAAGIVALHQGHSLISPLMAAKLLSEFAQMSDRATVAEVVPSPALELPRLTDRELQILRLVARGRLNREIAAELFISDNTVRNHIRNILDKLQMHSRMEAAMYAVRQRLIEPGE